MYTVPFVTSPPKTSSNQDVECGINGIKGYVQFQADGNSTCEIEVIKTGKSIN